MKANPEIKIYIREDAPFCGEAPVVFFEKNSVSDACSEPDGRG